MKNKRKVTPKIVIFILALIMFLTPSLIVEATNVDANDSDTLKTAWENGESVVFYDSANIKVDGYKNRSGDMIFNQYVNDKLIQKDTIRANNKDIIEREFWGDSMIWSAVHNDSVRLSDYVTVKKSGGSEAVINTVAGTIIYRSLSDTGYIYYGLRCTYDTIDAGNTVYTGISIMVDSIIQGLVSNLVACYETDYNWILTDTTIPSHSKNVYGGKYYIIDAKSEVKGNTYYEGYVPKDWKTQALAVWLHDEMFSDLNWEVVSWS